MKHRITIGILPIRNVTSGAGYADDRSHISTPGTMKHIKHYLLVLRVDPMNQVFLLWNNHHS